MKGKLAQCERGFQQDIDELGERPRGGDKEGNEYKAEMSGNR